jgi:polyphenol oxidase
MDKFILPADFPVFKNIHYGFLTRNVLGSGVYNPAKEIAKEILLSNQQNALKAFGCNYHEYQLSVTNQIHSNEVIEITKHQQDLHDCDAQITKLPKILLAVQTADCVPILFADDQNKIISSIHAGWRGARYDIIKNTINNMLNLGANINNINAIIGPHIRQENYEISQEFYENFMNENKNNISYFIPSKNDSHYMFNLTKYVTDKILAEKINNIYDIAIDSFANLDNCFSYRAYTKNIDKNYGSLLSIIGLK